MKKRNIALALITTLGVSTVIAATNTIDFSGLQTKGSFNCVASDPLATITMDTKDIKVNGFCAGNKYVAQDGHIKDMPTSELSDHYFEVEKSFGTDARVVVTVSNGELACTQGHGQKTTLYGDGHFCLSK